MSPLSKARCATSGWEFELSAVRSLGYRGLAGVARLATAARLIERGLRVLGYHDVPDEAMLRDQLDWLTSRFDVVGLGEGLARLRSGRDLERAALITFDDADPSVVSRGLPVLDEFEIEAVMFVCPGVVDTYEPYWWQLVSAAATARVVIDGLTVTQSDVTRLKTVDDRERREFLTRLRDVMDIPRPEVRQMSGDYLRLWVDAGHSIGNHTWDHPILHACGVQEQEKQIREAHTWLTERGLMDLAVFAYPNGNQTDHSESVLRDLGYQAAMLFDHRLATNGNEMAISRLRVNADDAMEVFIAKVSGFHPALHRLAGRQ